MKKALQFGLVGAGFGLCFSFTILTYATFFTHTSISGEIMLKQYIFSLILGIGCGLISTIFESEKLSITKQLIIHYFGILSFVLICGYIAEWYGNPFINPLPLISVIIIQIVIYIIVWLILYFMINKEVEFINDVLRKRNDNDE